MINKFLIILIVVVVLIYLFKTNIMKWLKGVDDAKVQSANVQAFLSTIKHSEGTDKYPNPYIILFGGSTFTDANAPDYSRHPHTIIHLNGYNSSAAGAYQINSATWDTVIQPALELPDFSPASQDTAAAYLIKEHGALDDVTAGNFAAAIQKCSGIWASLPGNSYGQPQKSLAYLADYYQQAGGVISNPQNIA